MSNWSYVRNGQQAGPIDTAALQTLLTNGTLTADTLVWREGMSAWAPARTLPEFGGSTAPSGDAPPPLATSAAPLPGGTPPPATGPQSDAADIEANKIFALLAYIGILFLVPLLAAPQSKFARYHANQGIVLFLAVLITMAGSVIAMFIPVIGCLATFLPFVFMAGGFVFMILGIINAASGQYKPLPLIGHFKLLN
jgi:uncharacterized membrane protein